MSLEFKLKFKVNDATILTNFGGVKLYNKNNIYTKLRNLWSRNVLEIGLGTHINHNYSQTSWIFLPMEIET